MTETNFQEEWLAIRYPFDLAARNKEVEAAFLDYFYGYDELQIIDIGSGTGNNFRYWFSKLPISQSWTFVELNPLLAEISLAKAKKYLEASDWEVSISKNQLSASFREGVQKHKKIRIQILETSFLELPFGHQLLGNPDFLMANAVFDLLTAKMFDRFAEQLIEHKIPLLSTINFVGMRFQNPTKEDELFTNYYLQHMQRLQTFGRTLGTDCTTHATSFFKKKGQSYTLGESNWIVKKTDEKMLLWTLGYMEEAVPSMLKDKAEEERFMNWLAVKREQVKQQKLELIVYHYDWFSR